MAEMSTLQQKRQMMESTRRILFDMEAILSTKGLNQLLSNKVEVLYDQINNNLCDMALSINSGSVNQDVENERIRLICEFGKLISVCIEYLELYNPVGYTNFVQKVSV